MSLQAKQGEAETPSEVTGIAGKYRQIFMYRDISSGHLHLKQTYISKE